MAFLILLSISASVGPVNDTIIINEWWYLGPFPVGVREGITGLEFALRSPDFRPDTTKNYFSFLAPGGVIRWGKISTPDEHVKVEYSEIPWVSIQEYYGVAGLMSASIFYGVFESKTECTALVSAQGVGSFILNGRIYPGDLYQDGYVMIPVILNKGINKVILKPMGFGEHSFTFKIFTHPPALLIIHDFTLPDFIRGEAYNGYLGVPIMNTTNQMLNDLKIEIGGEKILRTEYHGIRLFPQTLLKVPVPLQTAGVIEEGESIQVQIQVGNDVVQAYDSVWIKIKRPDEPYARTFISQIDHSCQYYSILPPRNFIPESTYALIVSCHGADVEARRQILSYDAKDWAYIVAPTNRRRYGFDWQDWGELDLFEVLADAKKSFKIDENRVYLTGHSMGGHGVWHIGLAHPDLFAAIAPSAGWTNFWLYLPWFLQRSEIFAEPELLKFRDMILRKDNPLVFLENALNLPIYILHGGADENVPPVHSRMMAQFLKELNYDFVYKEIPGQVHWWDIDSTPGIDCVDLKEMMDFLKTKKRNPYPDSIIFYTADIHHANRAYWLRIDELENNHQDGRVKAKIVKIADPYSPRTDIFVTIQNIRRFTIFLDTTYLQPGAVRLVVNGKEKEIKFKQSCALTFDWKSNRVWVTRFEYHDWTQEKSVSGPIKRVYFNPFILVYGTAGDSIDTENNLHQARLQSYTWWLRANGRCEILPDSAVTAEHIKNFNLILFGSARTNFLIKKINDKLPINFFNSGADGERIAINGKRLKNPDLCLMEVYPNPLNRQKLILLYSATTKAAQQYIGLFPVIYSGSGLPDFIIWDGTAAQKGWAGIVACGFFDNNGGIKKK
ncbi:MAG: prolyl oligopeptidase family serine peptidase [candidate division WOR-3 bacterium]